jgi:cell division protein ZapA
MAEVTIYINGRSYDIACDNGQEGRIVDLAKYIDQRVQQISRSGSAYNDAHLTVLTSLVLADELFEAREQATAAPRATARTAQPVAAPATPAEASISKEEESALLKVLEKITKRIEGVASRVAQAS